ncbi:serine/threonine protein kinase [Actinotignum urinale]|uniref:Serine/threonine-protein kinase n=1 Tax=Actinotignum urinale TaxID=190146 RepID=A0AAW9HTS1_9ACTO|nr:serine/threonine-protein kinase [Actinotignum urinale]MDY5154259.1 serine/threonine-protein kinase [Actinotignum urinale]
MMKNVGGYDLVRTLGTGGMSTVYEAVDGGGHHVALKLIHPAIVDTPSGRARLQREIATLQKVRGPHVAEVLDAETDGPEAFIVTQLIDGPTLYEDVRTNGTYTLPEASLFSRQLVRAIREVHSLGVLHRDIKPSNVMLDGNVPVLIDFGIAQADNDSRLTSTGAVTHTPGYLDPRVVQGHEPDEAADLWAVVAVILFTLIGRDPFRGPTAISTIQNVISGNLDVAGLPTPLAQAFREHLLNPLEMRPSIDTLIDAIDNPTFSPHVSPIVKDDDEATFAHAVPVSQVGEGVNSADADSYNNETVPFVPGEGATAVFDPSGNATRVYGVGDYGTSARTPEAGVAPTVALQAPQQYAPGATPATSYAPAPSFDDIVSPPANQEFIPESWWESEENIPPWKRPIQKFPFITLIWGIAIIMALALLELPLYIAFVSCIALFSTIGFTNKMYRYELGMRMGKRKGAIGATLFRFPLLLISGLFMAVLSTVVAALGGLLAYSLLASHTVGLDKKWWLVATFAIVATVTWWMPSSHYVRRGLRVSLSQVVTTPVLHLVWACVGIVFVVVLSYMYIHSAGGMPLRWSVDGVYHMLRSLLRF